MDNNAFERHMIDFVNTNAKTAETQRADHFQRDMEKWMERRKAEKIQASIKVVVWILCYIALIAMFGVLSFLELVPIELTIPIVAGIGFITGGIVCSLVNKI